MSRGATCIEQLCYRRDVTFQALCVANALGCVVVFHLVLTCCHDPITAQPFNPCTASEPTYTPHNNPTPQTASLHHTPSPL